MLEFLFMSSHAAVALNDGFQHIPDNTDFSGLCCCLLTSFASLGFASSVRLQCERSLRNDYTHSCITYRLANIFYTAMTHNVIDLYGQILRQMPSFCLYTNSAWEYVTGKKCVKETSFDWPA